MTKEQFVKYIDSGMYTVLSPAKTIAHIYICGGMCIDITEQCAWTKPTKAQAKKLHNDLCIDVEFYDADKDAWIKLWEDN